MGSNKNWTAEEIEILESKWGAVRIETISKKLGRSKSAIQNKAFRLGLGDSRLGGDKISLNQFSLATGICTYTIKMRWIREGFVLSIMRQGNHKVHKIDMKYFWKWAEEHKKLINFAKWEPGILGEEPEWVKEKRKADYSDPSRLGWNRPWTKEEDTMLMQKTKTYRYTYGDLAKEFNRTECAIKRRLDDLNVPYRAVPRDNHIKWTEEENRMMIELDNKGYSTAAIAKVLGKTQLSICDRLKKYKNTVCTVAN